MCELFNNPHLKSHKRPHVVRPHRPNCCTRLGALPGGGEVKQEVLVANAPCNLYGISV